MTRFVDLDGVWVNPELVTSVTSVDGQTYVAFGADAILTNLTVGAVVGRLEDISPYSTYRTTVAQFVPPPKGAPS